MRFFNLSANTNLWVESGNDIAIDSNVWHRESPAPPEFFALHDLPAPFRSKYNVLVLPIEI